MILCAIGGPASDHLFKEEKMTRILLTGGAGFIGSNVADRFIEDGHKVAIFRCGSKHPGKFKCIQRVR